MVRYEGFSRQLVLHLPKTSDEILRKLVERHGTENEGLTQIELIEEIGKAKSTISDAVTYLEENDFVVKQSTSGRKPELIKLKNPGLFTDTQ